MKIFKNLFLLAAVLFFTTSCSNDEKLNDGLLQESEIQFTDEELKVLYQMRGENNKVGIEEATRFANDVIGFLDGEVAVKSGTARTISSVQALSSANIQSVALKSGEGVDIEIPDTVAYVFNFGDDAGYAIISGDTRIEDPILAYTGNGTLDKEIDNPGLALFLDGTEDYILRSIVNAEQQRDSLINSIIAKLETEDESDTKLTISSLLTYAIRTTSTTSAWTRVSQKYPLSPVEWGQGSEFQNWPEFYWEPYWDLVRFKNCSAGTSPAGCVAVATAHIMSYWKYPSTINGYTFHWDELNKYTGGASSLNKSFMLYAPQSTKTEVARLMERIGVNIGMSYGCSGSGAKTGDAVRFLIQNGYKYNYKVLNMPYGLNYDYNTVIASLDKNQPVLIDGYSSKTSHKFLGITIYTTYGSGHAWVVDGYISQRQEVTTKVELIQASTGKIISQSTSTSYNYMNYLHNNWGWAGIDNGYFISGSFDSNQADLPSNTKGTEGNYQYDIDIYPYITR